MVWKISQILAVFNFEGFPQGLGLGASVLAQPLVAPSPRLIVRFTIIAKCGTHSSTILDKTILDETILDETILI